MSLISCAMSWSAAISGECIPESSGGRADDGSSNRIGKKLALIVEFADQTSVHFLVDPGLADRLLREEHQKVRAVRNSFVDLLPQAVARIDAPLVPPGFDAFGLKCLGNSPGHIEIVRCVA